MNLKILKNDNFSSFHMHTIPQITAQIGDQIRFVCPKRDASDKDGDVFIVYKVRYFFSK